VEKNPQVIAAYAELLADQVFIILIQKDSLQQCAILGGKIVQRSLHQPPPLLGQHSGFRTRVAAGKISRGKLRQTLIPPEHLQHDVTADGVYVGSQPFRVLDGPPPETPEHSQQCLLANVVGGLPGAQAGIRLDSDQVAEIAGEVVFCFRITLSEPPEIVHVK